jgi:hypothetical protein
LEKEILDPKEIVPMRRFVLFWIVAAMSAAAARSWGAGAIVIVTLSNIETAGKSSATLDFAAEELARYLKAITGEDYPLERQAERSRSATARLSVDQALQEDEYRISRVGSVVEISGGSPRGCLYGTYRFLERLGCRWPLPGKDYEVVPRRTEIGWSGPEVRSRPVMRHRGLMWIPISYDDDLLDLIDYLAKNGFNFVTICGDSIPKPYLAGLDEALRRRDLGVEWGGHLLSSYLPRAEFQKHPEYFRMAAGKRTASQNMCPSSAEAAEIIARRSLADWQRLQGFPRLETLHFWPDDLLGSAWCGCPRCAGLSDSDQSLKILNAVAERLPLDRTALAHLSYHATIQSPRKVKPHANVRLFYAPRERCYRHAMGECPTNQRYLARLKSQVGWFPNDPEVMEYYMDMVLYRQMPLPLHPVIGRDVKVYREAGIDRITSLAFQRYSDWAYGMNYYLLGKALWRGEGDPQDIEEYCRAVYGPAAGPMKRYFDRLFELGGTALETCGYTDFVDMRYPPDEPFTATHVAHLSPLVAEERLDEIEDLATKARQAVEEPYRSRIDRQLVLWKVARLESRAMYDTMHVMQRMKDFREGKVSPDARRRMIADIQEAITNIEQAGEILLTAPEGLRGPHVFRSGGLVGDDRMHGYVARPKDWLKELTAAK